MWEKATDIRITKTVTALYKSFYILLKQYNFNKITVEALCAEARISRATFYSHFSNKYDLLTKWMITFLSKNIGRDDSYDKIEKTLNQIINENKRVLKNIADDADSDTLRGLHEVAHFVVNFNTKENAGEKKRAKDVVWDSFFFGGFVYYVSLQWRDNGLPDITPVNIHLYTMI